MKVCDLCSTNENVKVDRFQKIDHMPRHPENGCSSEINYDACDSCHKTITDKISTIIKGITLRSLIDAIKSST